MSIICLNCNYFNLKQFVKQKEKIYQKEIKKIKGFNKKFTTILNLNGSNLLVKEKVPIILIIFRLLMKYKN